MTLLPEAEVLRKELEREVVGKRIKAVIGGAPDAELDGQRIEAVMRHGTSLALRLKGGGALVVRPGSISTSGDDPASLVLQLDGGGSLHVQHGRLVSSEELANSPEFQPMGIDPFTNTATWLEFSRQLHIRNSRLRALLGDETFVVGLGDVYSDEILWAAGLSGLRVSSALTAQEVRRLYRAIQEVLHEAVKQGGGVPDPADGQDLDPFDDPLASEHLKVYGREGQPCARCRQPIRHAPIDDPPIPTYSCPNCQT